jgi:hypothetical protein
VVARRTEPLSSIIDHVFATTDVTGETAGPDDRTMVLVRS